MSVVPGFSTASFAMVMMTLACLPACLGAGCAGCEEKKKRAAKKCNEWAGRSGYELSYNPSSYHTSTSYFGPSVQSTVYETSNIRADSLQRKYS